MVLPASPPAAAPVAAPAMRLAVPRPPTSAPPPLAAPATAPESCFGEWASLAQPATAAATSAGTTSFAGDIKLAPPNRSGPDVEPANGAKLCCGPSTWDLVLRG